VDCEIPASKMAHKDGPSADLLRTNTPGNAAAEPSEKTLHESGSGSGSGNFASWLFANHDSVQIGVALNSSQKRRTVAAPWPIGGWPKPLHLLMQVSIRVESVCTEDMNRLFVAMMDDTPLHCPSAS